MRITRPEQPERKDLSGYGEKLLLEMYRRMLLIRRFELKVNELYREGRIPGTIHLSHGQEATTVGACLALDRDDVITLTHRGHGQALAKGVSVESTMAELFGKATGCCRGKGGSLHVGDLSVGALPAIGIVGASSPIAAGMAFAFQRAGNRRIVLNFFGDGAVNEGDWHEAMNLAALWKLPVVFLCENNFYGVSTHISDVVLNEYLVERAAAYRMRGVTIYGNDPITVYDTVREAAGRARDGAGPTMVECLTYRRGGHKRDDQGSYRPEEEVDAWFRRDPITDFRDYLLTDRRITPERLDVLEREIERSVDEAVDFALASPDPDATSALEDVYAK
jgi:TPP-dependent pyruvate/acetoin dehydrogenase alpha subunit